MSLWTDLWPPCMVYDMFLCPYVLMFLCPFRVGMSVIVDRLMAAMYGL